MISEQFYALAGLPVVSFTIYFFPSPLPCAVLARRAVGVFLFLFLLSLLQCLALTLSRWVTAAKPAPGGDCNRANEPKWFLMKSFEETKDGKHFRRAP